MTNVKVDKETRYIKKNFKLDEILRLLHELTWVLIMKNEKEGHD